MGGKVDSNAPTREALSSQLASKYGSHVTTDWLVEHGITTEENITSAVEDTGRYAQDLESFIGGLSSGIEGVETQEMTELDEQWAIDKRKTMKKGKTSLLSGGTTGLGVEETVSTSLLK